MPILWVGEVPEMSTSTQFDCSGDVPDLGVRPISLLKFAVEEGDPPKLMLTGLVPGKYPISKDAGLVRTGWRL